MAGPRLDDAAADLYADLRLAPVLRQVLRHSGRLMDATAGSVSLVDEPGGTYEKVAEQGAPCRLGQRFPLDEGLTGRVVAQRGPVVVDRYGDVAGAHLPVGHATSRGAAVAVPLWWRGEVVGANVVFAGRRRRFTVAEVDGLEALTALAAPAVVRSGGPSGGRVRGRLGLAPADPPQARPTPASPLTPREREVLALLGRGLGDRAVAAELVVSHKTVEKHVGAVLRKTGTASRTAAVVRAIERGWLPAPGGADG